MCPCPDLFLAWGVLHTASHLELREWLLGSMLLGLTLLE